MFDIQFNTFEKSPVFLDFLNSFWAGLGALSAFGTFCIALYAFRSISRWKTEKVLEKKSLIAEEVLDLLESYIEVLNQWLIFANSGWVFSRNSADNLAQLYKLSEEQKKEFIMKCNEDLYELHNFCRSFQKDLSEFIRAKNKALRLGDSAVSERFSQLEAILKPLPLRLARLHHVSLPETEKQILREYLEEQAGSAIEEKFSAIQKLLLSQILFEGS